MSNTEDTEAFKLAPAGDNWEKVSSASFSSKIHIENRQHEDDDKYIDFIMTIGDDD